MVFSPFTVRRTRIAVTPPYLPKVIFSAARPVPRASESSVLAHYDRILRPGMRLSLGWRATWLSTRNGTIIADGGTVYRRSSRDLFQPAITFRSPLVAGLAVELRHDERLRTNMDSVLFGPRPMTLGEWANRDRRADFQRSLSDEARLSWHEGEGFELSGHILSTAYRNRMVPDERGVLHSLSGSSRSRDYGLTAQWRLAPHMRLSASARTEAMQSGIIPHSDRQRRAFALGLERKEGQGNIVLRILRQDSVRFKTADLDRLTEWGLETVMEGPLTTPNGVAEIRFRLHARSMADNFFHETGILASRDLQPQIRVDLLARW